MAKKFIIKFNWYSIVFFEKNTDEWNNIISNLKDEEIIWGVVQLNNLFFFASSLDTVNIKNLILLRSNERFSFFLSKIDSTQFINPSNTQIILTQNVIADIADADSIVILPKENMPEKKKEKKRIKVDDIPWSSKNKEEILNSILDKINKIGFEKLSDKEKKFLKEGK